MTHISLRVTIPHSYDIKKKKLGYHSVQDTIWPVRNSNPEETDFSLFQNAQHSSVAHPSS
jgi:hypothetical protein